MRDDVMHAGLAVLRSETLWDAITACMDGYPRALSLFYRENTCTSDRKSSSNAAFLQLLQRDDSLARDGVLPHLAVVTGSAGVLRLVHKFCRQQQTQRQPLDPKLSLARVMYCAVLFQRVDMLECIIELQARDSAWACEKNLMACALRRPADANVSVLEWLYCHLPPELRVLEPSVLCTYARTKRVDVVQWLHEHGCPVSQRAVDGAVHGRHAPMLAYLCAHSSSRCSRSAFEDAASSGYLNLVKLIVETNEADLTRQQETARSQPSTCTTARDLADLALEDLNASLAMDGAARNGHLDVLAYLHTHRVGECTVRAMDDAAANGHLDVVAFLHCHRTEGCSTNAMDCAAARGHLDVVEFLHTNRSEGCTPNALTLATRNRHESVMRFLCAHRPECDVATALADAAAAGNMDDIKLFHASLRAGESAYAAVKAAAQKGKTKVVAYLCAHQEHEQTRLLDQAIADDRADWVVQAICAFATTSEVLEATRCVDPLQRPRVARILERRMRALRMSGCGGDGDGALV